MRYRLPPLLGGILIAALALTPPARAADQVHAAKAAGVAWTFTLLNVGIEQDIFAQYGLDVDTADMAGDARLQQALASGAVDFGLGSGPSMALAAKGGQAIAVAAFAGEPRNLAIIVGSDSPIKTVANLKGKKMMFEDDGHFDPQAIDVLQQSFVAMGLAPERIPDDKLYTTQFLPVKP